LSNWRTLLHRNGWAEKAQPDEVAKNLYVRGERIVLEKVPQELVVDLVVILHFGRFDEGA
jgi:hypothetical protein